MMMLKTAVSRIPLGRSAMASHLAAATSKSYPNGILFVARNNSSSATTTTEERPPVPPFSYEDAVTKVRMAENAWNTCDPDRVKMAYTVDSVWRNRNVFIKGRDEIHDFLTQKWQTEQDYRLIKEIWVHSDNRIAVRFSYEFHNPQGEWFRAYGNEHWEFDAHGLMKIRHASINDVPITNDERLFHWDRNGPRPDDHPGLKELDLFFQKTNFKDNHKK